MENLWITMIVFVISVYFCMEVEFNLKTIYIYCNECLFEKLNEKSI